ncbi:magnesium/cobalt transporter CorA [Candidatus Micrarchaeota archaeon]|nr:magnesium/cobalt transporter CorA [Candidatus Micrarchaeota archaeon]
MITAFGIVDGKVKSISETKKIHVLIKSGSKVWVDLQNPTREEMHYLENELKLHHLALEDSLTQHQRAKVERYEDFHYVVVHTVTENEALKTTQLNLFIGKNFLISLHMKKIGFIDDVSASITAMPELFRRGPDYVAYMLLDRSADLLFPTMDRLESDLDKVEELVFREKESGRRSFLELLLSSKRKLLHLRKIAWPQMEVLNILSSGELAFVSRQNLVYYRDIYDHLIRINSMIESQRELLSASMEGHRLSISNSLNQVMKKLTAITAIVTVPAMIAGIYGMNFTFIPELKWELGFYVAIVSMLLATALLAMFFKRKDWI